MSFLPSIWMLFVNFLTSLGRGILNLLNRLKRIIKNIVGVVSHWIIEKAARIKTGVKRVFLLQVETDEIRKNDTNIASMFEEYIKEASRKGINSLNLDEITFSVIYDEKNGIESVEDIGVFDINEARHSSIDASLIEVLDQDKILEFDKGDIDSILTLYT